jgi:hypothetical protein
MLGLSPKPAWAEVWHLWNVILPRRSITGRLLAGRVWRRHDGRRWIYKEFAEYSGLTVAGRAAIGAYCRRRFRAAL